MEARMKALPDVITEAKTRVLPEGIHVAPVEARMKVLPDVINEAKMEVLPEGIHVPRAPAPKLGGGRARGD
jgi:hypothetical protein